MSLYISTLLIWEGLSLLGLGPGQKADEEAGTEEEEEAVVGEAVAAGGKDVAGFCGTVLCRSGYFYPLFNVIIDQIWPWKY